MKPQIHHFLRFFKYRCQPAPVKDVKFYLNALLCISVTLSGVNRAEFGGQRNLHSRSRLLCTARGLPTLVAFINMRRWV